jgi:catechol 2,3-dioxygenase-like lactoylglutathione lyase family enzyme
MPKPKSENWYTRPVLFVSNIEEALNFYCDKLGFEKAWDYGENGATIVVQVNRGKKCEVILSLNADRAGMSRLFIELLSEELKHFKAEIKKRNILSKDSFWGMPIIAIQDPSGNELFFPTG